MNAFRSIKERPHRDSMINVRRILPYPKINVNQ